ncbi:MAG: hypothetical protein RL034_457 [Bacteroidota bacterium]|jgi:hypothetical protein
MEVHHHAGHHGPKKWKEYITEFLMLFLAVTLGFLAENIREEQVIAHQTESVIAQLRLELMQDTAQLTVSKNARSKSDTAVGFIAYFIKNKQLKENKETFYLLHTYVCYRSGLFESGCLALDQLKYTGLLKNIKNEKLRHAIELYSISLKNIENRMTRESNFMDKNIDELRTAPFDIYKAYGENLAYLNTEKGRIVTEVDLTCNNTTIHVRLLPTFIPENLPIKSFNEQEYLNTLFKLNGIRNSTQDRQSDLAYTRAVDIIKNIEAEYPNTLKNQH